MKGFFKIAPGLVKLLFANFEFLVGSLHICSVIVVRSSSYKRNETLLGLLLLFHVSVGKERTNNRVTQHVFIEFLNHGTDSILTS